MPYLIPQNPPSLIPAGDLALQAGAASGQAEAARLLAGTLANSRRSVMANAQAMGSLGGPRVTTLQSALMEQERRRKAQADRQAADLEHRQRQMTWERDREAQLEDEKRTRGYQLEDEDRARAVREQDPVWIEQRRQAKEATSRAQAREAIERATPRISRLPFLGKAAQRAMDELTMSPAEAAQMRRERAQTAAAQAAQAAQDRAAASAAATDPVKREAAEKAKESTSRRNVRQAIARVAPRLAGAATAVPGLQETIARLTQAKTDELSMSPEDAVTARARTAETDARARDRQVSQSLRREEIALRRHMATLAGLGLDLRQRAQVSQEIGRLVAFMREEDFLSSPPVKYRDPETGREITLEQALEKARASAMAGAGISVPALPDPTKVGGETAPAAKISTARIQQELPIATPELRAALRADIQQNPSRYEDPTAALAAIEQHAARQQTTPSAPAPPAAKGTEEDPNVFPQWEMQRDLQTMDNAALESAYRNIDAGFWVVEGLPREQALAMIIAAMQRGGAR